MVHPRPAVCSQEDYFGCAALKRQLQRHFAIREVAGIGVRQYLAPRGAKISQSLRSERIKVADDHVWGQIRCSELHRSGIRSDNQRRSPRPFLHQMGVCDRDGQPYNRLHSLPPGVILSAQRASFPRLSTTGRTIFWTSPR